jgi:hypothetical protein
MKIIRTILERIIKKKQPTPVGRWKTEDCDIKTNNKIDLSNEDHCGPCGQYVLEKIKSKTENKKSTSSLPK